MSVPEEESDFREEEDLLDEDEDEDDEDDFDLDLDDDEDDAFLGFVFSSLDSLGRLS